MLAGFEIGRGVDFPRTHAGQAPPAPFGPKHAQFPSSYIYSVHDMILFCARQKELVYIGIYFKVCLVACIECPGCLWNSLVQHCQCAILYGIPEVVLDDLASLHPGYRQHLALAMVQSPS